MSVMKVLSITAAMALAAAAYAQPANDACVNAAVIANGEATPFDTTAATMDGGSNCGFQNGHDIWYRYTACSGGVVTASTCGSGFDTVLTIYADSCGGAVLACNDDFCGLQSTASANVAAGQTIYVQVAGYFGLSGTGSLTVTQASNDACANAFAVTDGSSTPFSTTCATTDGVTECGFNTVNDIWYTYTAPSAGTITASTCGANFDTVVSLYADSCAGALIACNDDACGLQSTISGPIASGQTVVIRVAGYNGQSGSGSLAVNFLPSGAPSNDNCAQALAVSNGTPVAFNTTNATTDGATNCGFQNGKDIWFSYTACSAGAITASTCGSSFDTVVTIYDGCGGSVLACNDDNCGLQSNATASVAAGQTVVIQVSGFFGESGAGTFSVTQTGNDACANAVAVTSGSNTPFDNTCATTDGGSNCGFQNSHDIWYSFNSASAGTLSVSTCGSNFDTVLTAYADSCGGAVLACNDDSCGLQSNISAPVSAGQTILIQLAGFFNNSGSGNLAVNFVPSCTADFNHDEVVDFFDYLDFVDAFSANDPSADFNHDDVIDFFDYLDFVDAFSAGC